MEPSGSPARLTGAAAFFHPSGTGASRRGAMLLPHAPVSALSASASGTSEITNASSFRAAARFWIWLVGKAGLACMVDTVRSLTVAALIL